jgi:hypothetical protein
MCQIEKERERSHVRYIISYSFLVTEFFFSFFQEEIRGRGGDIEEEKERHRKQSLSEKESTSITPR